MRHLAAVAAVLVAATACGGPEPPRERPDAAGTLRLSEQGGFLVRSRGPWRDCPRAHIGPSSGDDELSRTTVLVESLPGRYVEATWEALAAGQTVDVWFHPDSAVLLVCPWPAITGTVVVRKPG